MSGQDSDHLDGCLMSNWMNKEFLDAAIFHLAGLLWHCYFRLYCAKTISQRRYVVSVVMQMSAAAVSDWCTEKNNHMKLYSNPSLNTCKCKPIKGSLPVIRIFCKAHILTKLNFYFLLRTVTAERSVHLVGWCCNVALYDSHWYHRASLKRHFWSVTSTSLTRPQYTPAGACQNWELEDRNISSLPRTNSGFTIRLVC